MISEVLQSGFLQAFIEKLQTNNSLLVEHLSNAPKAILCLLAKQATKKNILIVSGKKDDHFLDNFLYLQGKEILDFPPCEELSSEDLPLSSDITGRRMEILYEIAEKKKDLIVHTDIHALMQKTLSPKSLLSYCQTLKVGKEVSFKDLPSYLTSLGYQRRPVASDKGEFSIRGGILDIFPISSTDPFRIDFFGDVIDSIRRYDPVSQKTVGKTKEVFISLASEQELIKKESKLATLLDYLGKDTLIILDDLLLIEDQYVSLKTLPSFQSNCLFSLEELLKKLPHFTHMFFLQQSAEDLSDVSMPSKQGRKFYNGADPFQPLSFEFFNSQFSSLRFHHPFEEVSDFFSHLENRETSTLEETLQGIQRRREDLSSLTFITRTPSEKKMLEAKLEGLEIKLPKKTDFQMGYLSSGFVLADIKAAFVATADLTHKKKVRRQKWRNNYHNTPSDYLQLIPGDITVHFHHGIGKFLGIEKLPNNQGQETEYLLIEYAKDNKLYVPVAQSHLVSRYVGAKDEHIAFNILGSNKWSKTCKKTQTSIVGYAKELLERAATRSAHSGFCYPEDSVDMQMFEEEFPFEETEDQSKAISACRADMCSTKAMDRLVCGDVGYGKTEIAMRAAFKAVSDGKKQVAVLVPTTVLAVQHYETFVDRMSNFPIRIAVLSRFNSAKETKAILKKVSEGELDILIGTHRIISKDVSFKDLGLLVIDEEQRFGVRAKEHLKAMKVGVDCLTLSATPIPRTLYMSLIGIKEVSVVSTPPQDRLPIRTMIAEKNSELIKNALLREFSRNGQAFFIHNRVESLPKVQAEISKLLPEARILTGHGQMDAEEIDSIFHSFKQGEADLLISTTIVENGIDISNANTIFIDQADKFGMADLYQLRGRVGRWNRPAYAYFLVNRLQAIPEIPRKRLQALSEASGYGGGLKIAMRDLEIRGAGDILGDQQSGQVSAVGFHLYCKLLKRAIDAIKTQKPVQFMETKLEHSFDASIPDYYIDVSEIRMELYHRLGSCHTPKEIDELLTEMEDRFGKAPEPTLLLCLLTRIRLKASELNILSVKFTRSIIRLEKQFGSKVVIESVTRPSMKSLVLFEEEMMKILQGFAQKRVH